MTDNAHTDDNTSVNIDIDDHINEAIREMIHEDTEAWAVTTIRESGDMSHTWYTPGYVGEYPTGLCMIAYQIKQYVELTGEDYRTVLTAAVEFAELIDKYDMEYVVESD